MPCALWRDPVVSRCGCLTDKAPETRVRSFVTNFLTSLNFPISFLALNPTRMPLQRASYQIALIKALSTDRFFFYFFNGGRDTVVSETSKGHVHEISKLRPLELREFAEETSKVSWRSLFLPSSATCWSSNSQHVDTLVTGNSPERRPGLHYVVMENVHEYSTRLSTTFREKETGGNSKQKFKASVSSLRCVGEDKFSSERSGVNDQYLQSGRASVQTSGALALRARNTDQLPVWAFVLKTGWKCRTKTMTKSERFDTRRLSDQSRWSFFRYW